MAELAENGDEGEGLEIVAIDFSIAAVVDNEDEGDVLLLLMIVPVDFPQAVLVDEGAKLDPKGDATAEEAPEGPKQ